MKTWLEAVTILMLFFLTPVIVAWVLIGLARVIENIGDLPIDERGTPAGCHWTSAFWGGCARS
jgi:hypothetical protein